MGGIEIWITLYILDRGTDFDVVICENVCTEMAFSEIFMVYYRRHMKHFMLLLFMVYYYTINFVLEILISQG